MLCEAFLFRNTYIFCRQEYKFGENDFVFTLKPVKQIWLVFQYRKKLNTDFIQSLRVSI